MINRYKQILFLYWRNRGFRILSGLFLFSALLSRLLYHGGYAYFLEEVITVLFIVSLWGAFYFGMMIKWQFASCRASLWPNYRSAHITIVLVLYVLALSIGCVWEFSLRALVYSSPYGLWGIYFTCLFISTLVTYIGYLSIGKILLYAYVLLYLFSLHASQFVQVLERSPYFIYALAGGFLITGAFFIHRLSNIKEDDFDYHFFFHWPPKNFFMNEMRASQNIGMLFNPLLRIFPARKEVIHIPKYFEEPGIFAQAFHWDFSKHRGLKALWGFLLLTMPLFFLLVNRQAVLDIFKSDVYSNFLLLAITPVLIVLGANYRRFCFWGYDILKPLDKKKYMGQQGIVLLISLVFYWALFAVYLGVLPNIVFHPSLIVAQRFWAYLIFTFDFSFLILCWLVLLSGLKSPVAVMAQVVAMGMVALVYFFMVSQFSFKELIGHMIACTLAGLYLCVKAYQVWCDKEFDSQ